METLDSFVTSSRPPPDLLFTSKEIQDRNSVFIGYIYKSTTPAESLRIQSYQKNVSHGRNKASHEIYAWRCMVLKQGKSGLGGPDEFEVKSGSKDDGERFAGARVLKVMESEGVMDAVVIVSRWYGGEQLGPVRFDHIDACAREVCRKFRVEEEMEEHIATLSSLDDILSTLRAELSDFKATISNNQIETTKSGSGDGVSDDTGVASPSSSQATLLSQETPIPSMTVGGKGPDYKSLRGSRDVKKVKRLVTARENSIKSVKIALKKMKEHPETQGKPRS